MFWSNEHDVFLCREKVNLNPFTSKKGSTQRSGIFKKIAQILNECTVRQRRSGSEAMEFLAGRAKMNYELKQQEFKMLQEQQALEREKMEAMAKQQLQTQQQQTEMFKVMQQQELLNTQMMMI